MSSRRTQAIVALLELTASAPISRAGAEPWPWPSFHDETASRLLSDPAVGSADVQEKDYPSGDVDQDGDIDLVCVRKQPWNTPGRYRAVLFMNEGQAEGHALNGVLVDRTLQYASAASDGGQGLLDPAANRDVVLVDLDLDGWLDIVTAATYGYFFGPVGTMKPRAPLVDIFVAARGSALPMVIPVIIMGGILTGWFTPTEAGMVAAIYILVVLIPVLNPRHIRRLPGDFMYTGMLYSLPLAAVAGASAFGWMLAYLRGPDTVAEYISYYAGTDPRMIMLLLVALFVIVGDFIDAVPAIIIFMPIILKLTQVGGINPVHMGVVIITTLVFGLITPPYGLSLLVASKFVGVPFYRAMFRSFPLYIVFFLTIAFTVFFPQVVLWLPKFFLPQSVGCFPSPTGAGYICPP